MFELRVALRRDSGLILSPAWVAWAPLCPALAAEDGLVLLRAEGAKRRLDPELLEEMVRHLDLASMLGESMARSANPRIRLRDLHTSFDALGSLQLLHWLRDHALPSQDWRSAMSALGFDAQRDLTEVLQDLIAHERRVCVDQRGLGD